MIKQSIVAKTITALVLSMSIIIIGVSAYIYNDYMDIIRDLQKDEKTTILKYLKKTEEDKIKQKLESLKDLTISSLGGISTALYNSDTETAKNVLRTIMLKNKSIKGVYIYDGGIDDTFLVAINGDKIRFSETLPKELNQYKYFKFELYHKNEDIGYISFYYDISDIIKEIKKLKEQEIAKYQKKVSQTNAEIKHKLLIQLAILVLVGAIVIILMILLIRKLVNEPLKEFKKGLDSFFKFLEDPKHKVEPINIDTEDEFGQMSRSVNESIKVSMKMHAEIANLMNMVDENVIISETDEKGIITHVSKAFCKISGFTKEELIGKYHNIVRHPDMPKEVFKELWNTIKSGRSWEGEVKNRKKDGGFYWVYTIISPKCTQAGAGCGYTAIRYDITDKKLVEDLSKNLEKKVEERTKELNSERKLISSIINSQDSIVVTSDGAQLTTINNAFKKFYEVESIEEFVDKYGPCICDSFEKDVDDEYIKKDMNGTPWIEYILANPNKVHKVVIKKNNELHIFTISVDSFIFEGQKFVTVVLNDVTELEKVQKQIAQMHQHTKESIEFASLLQGSLLPKSTEISKHFKDNFVFWKPKDIVGGDIYLFETLRNENECLYMVIDCTGHGVPGAFVTMIVKAVEREIVSLIRDNKMMDVSPAWVLGYFNNTIKKLLRQESPDSKSNAGFDGGIVYYNRNKQILKFAGAETPLFYVDEDGEVKTIKGTRYSVGYKKCEFDYKYKEHILEVKEGMKFYLTTDGYLDQNGGEKDFPFGKKKFKQIIQENHHLPMDKQKEIFIKTIEEYKNDEQNDDMTVVGFEIGPKSEIYEIFEYDGILTQAIITHHIDILEHSIDNMSMMGKLSTLVVEITQNMMKYSKTHEEGCRDIRPAGYIKVTQIQDEYVIESKNIVAVEDKERIESRLDEIKQLDEKEIKKRYRELRKSGEHTHDKGGGIGFFEIAKLVNNIDYKFEAINSDKYYFYFKVIVKPKKRK